MKKTVYIALLAFGCIFLTSCYNRYTSNFDAYPELIPDRTAIVDQSGLTPEDRQRRLEKLKKLDSQPPEIYRINAGDRMMIRVYDHPDLTTETPVTPDGHIGMILAGQVYVAGLTLPEASKKLEKALSAYIKNPLVGISPVNISSQTATIAGAVKDPGMYTITNDMRLNDLFAKAGGSSSRYYDGQTLDAADFKHSIFVRDGKLLEVDFPAAIEQGNYWNNIKLRKGDYIYIAVRSESMVCLIGEVNRPHKRIWDKNLGLLELITTGGGVKETYWKYAIIIRGGIANPTIYRVDLDGVLQGRKPNVILDAGDVVYIPKDDISEYNVFIRKLIPTGQLINLMTTPVFWYTRF